MYILKCTKEQMEGIMDNGYHYLVGLSFIRLYPLKKCVLIARHHDTITNKILNSLRVTVTHVELVESTGLNGPCKCMLTSTCFSYTQRITTISNNFIFKVKYGHIAGQTSCLLPHCYYRDNHLFKCHALNNTDGIIAMNN